MGRCGSRCSRCCIWFCRGQFADMQRLALCPPIAENPLFLGGSLVGAEGFEPSTSSASGKRSPPELSARWDPECTNTRHPRRRPESNRCNGFCRPVPKPLGHVAKEGRQVAPPGAEDGARTRDLNLGKVALYQLSYFRLNGRQCNGSARRATTPLTGRSNRIRPLHAPTREAHPLQRTPAERREPPLVGRSALPAIAPMVRDRG